MGHVIHYSCPHVLISLNGPTLSMLLKKKKKSYGSLKVLCPSEVADSEPVICCYWCNIDITVDISREKLVVQNTVTSIRVNLSWIVSGYRSLALFFFHYFQIYKLNLFTNFILFFLCNFISTRAILLMCLMKVRGNNYEIWTMHKANLWENSIILYERDCTIELQVWKIWWYLWFRNKHE